jgi:hypothetical protein
MTAPPPSRSDNTPSGPTDGELKVAAAGLERTRSELAACEAERAAAAEADLQYGAFEVTAAMSEARRWRAELFEARRRARPFLNLVIRFSSSYSLGDRCSITGNN